MVEQKRKQKEILKFLALVHGSHKGKNWSKGSRGPGEILFDVYSYSPQVNYLF